MIYSNSDLSRNITWVPEDNPQAADLAIAFLTGERDLMRLARVRSSSIVDLTTFLTLATEEEVEIKRGIGGEVLVCATDSGQNLLLTGKTAEVLRSYIDEEPVSTRDRDDMTIRILA